MNAKNRNTSRNPSKASSPATNGNAALKLAPAPNTEGMEEGKAADLQEAIGKREMPQALRDRIAYAQALLAPIRAKEAQAKATRKGKASVAKEKGFMGFAIGSKAEELAMLIAEGNLDDLAIDAIIGGNMSYWRVQMNHWNHNESKPAIHWEKGADGIRRFKGQIALQGLADDIAGFACR